jgi:dipeptidyl aminopeptidase/acylaminoacyl peptidase
MVATMNKRRCIGISLTAVALCFVLLTWAPWAGAQTPPLIDRELFFGNPTIALAQLSPDGRYIAFLQPLDGTLNIWVKKTKEPFSSARAVTKATDRPIADYEWTRDSQYILFVKDKGGDENFHLFSVDPANPEEPVDLTPYSNVRAEILCLPKSDPEVVYVGMNDRDERYHDAYRVCISTGERSLVRQNDTAVATWIFDKEGNLKLGLRMTDDGKTQLFRADTDDSTFLWECSKDEDAYPFAFHPDGRRLYMASNRGQDADRSRLVLLDTETGDEEIVDSDPKGEVDFDAPLFAPDTDELVATSYTGDRERIYWKNAEWERDYTYVAKEFPRGDVHIISATRANDRWLISVCSDTDPGSVYLYDRPSRKIELLYKSRPTLPSEFLSPMKPIQYLSRDGLTIHGYLTVPKGAAPSALPLVVFPHGGPWARDGWGYDAQAQFLANRGYAVLQMNFRGSTGYGKRFLNAGNKQWGDAMQNDITDGIVYLVHLGVADPARVAIFGGSYGGYAALAGLAFTPSLYAAGISYVGPSNLITLLETIPPYWASGKGQWEERIGSLNNPDDMARLKRQSPLFSARNITAPLLVVQGANDPRVKKAESDQIVSALRALGREVEYMVAPNEGHGFRCAENRLALAAEEEKFLSTHLGGRCQKEVPEPILERIRSFQQ